MTHIANKRVLRSKFSATFGSFIFPNIFFYSAISLFYVSSNFVTNIKRTVSRRHRDEWNRCALVWVRFCVPTDRHQGKKAHVRIIAFHEQTTDLLSIYVCPHAYRRTTLTSSQWGFALQIQCFLYSLSHAALCAYFSQTKSKQIFKWECVLKWINNWQTQKWNSTRSNNSLFSFRFILRLSFPLFRINFNKNNARADVLINTESRMNTLKDTNW